MDCTTELDVLQDVFEWEFTIDDALVGECICSPAFKGKQPGGPVIRLQVYPNGHSCMFKNYVSIFVQPTSTENFRTITHLDMSLYSGDRLLENRVKEAELTAFRPTGWFTFLERYCLKPSLIVWVTLLISTNRDEKLKLVFKYSSIESRLDEDGNANDGGELIRDFQSLQRSGYLSDFSLWADGKEIKAHVSVLSIHSPAFRCLFEKQMPKRSHLVVPEASYESCHKMVSFLYTGKVDDLTPASAVELYSLAHRFAVYSLTETCVQYLKEHCRLENISDVLVFAERWGERSLKGHAMDFVKKNYDAISKAGGWGTAFRSNRELELEVLRFCLRKRSIDLVTR